MFLVAAGSSLTTFLSLASQKIAIAEKSPRFQIAKCRFASFAAEIAEIPPEELQKHRSDFLGRGLKIAAFPRFQDRSVFGMLIL